MESSTIPQSRRLRAGLAGGLICVGSVLTMPYAMAADPAEREIIAPARDASPAGATTSTHPAHAEPDTGFGPLGTTL
ncbi:hypothetical protein [Streptomyces indicus]|uniref:Uncharacterized protein n=1 Tax=Streptomyces indicus TaxID=417292 RepID=A0A1G9HDY4_9ACTN|nr:hypothetical protein [Streptomyces indicus]SDL11046.1 hypothetical protein SAMN05421806_118139 [Streptomyces indicus]